MKPHLLPVRQDTTELVVVRGSPEKLRDAVLAMLEEVPEMMPAMPTEQGTHVLARRARYVADLLHTAGYTEATYPNVLWGLSRMALQFQMAWAACDKGPDLANHPSHSTRKDLDLRYATAKTSHMVEIEKQIRAVDKTWLED